MTNVGRFIIHADLDAFFASVEQRDNPALKGKPVVVGGRSEERGVVAAASYEARRFGVHSAMPMGRALRLCPQAIRVSPRFDRYREVSEQVMGIYRDVTLLVEAVSLDEAYLDVSQVAASLEEASGLAAHIKERVRQETRLTVSVGLASTKSVAKIASDLQKPDGLVVVPPGEERAFLAPLPVSRLWGVGPKTEAVLAQAGIETIGDLAEADPAWLQQRLGIRGLLLHELASGIDERPLELGHERKSIGREVTFAQDVSQVQRLQEAIDRLSEDVAGRLQRGGYLARTVRLKLRYADFTTITRQQSLAEATASAETIRSSARRLLDSVARPPDRFRLLGVTAASLERAGSHQLSLPIDSSAQNV